MSILFYKSFFLDIVNGENTDNDSTSMETSSPKVISDKLSNSEVSSDKGSSSKSMEAITFSPEMIKKYEKRFENGYNIFTDKSYVQWLKKFHPDHLPPRK